MDRDQPALYRHTQAAPQWVVFLISIFAIVMFSTSAYLLQTDETPAWLALFLILWTALIYLLLLNFTRLNIVVTPQAIELGWRLGWPTKRIDRTSIVAADPHRNSWLVGWGIRKVSRGWMWNVWGLDAVNLELDDGRSFRIGTDDVDGLLGALLR